MRTEKRIPYTSIDKPPIQIWKFEDAPKHFQALSKNGGDEDWLALIPEYIMSRRNINFLEEGTAFGCAHVEKHELKDGSWIWIGCHS